MHTPGIINSLNLLTTLGCRIKCQDGPWAVECLQLNLQRKALALPPELKSRIIGPRPGWATHRCL